MVAQKEKWIPTVTLSSSETTGQGRAPTAGRLPPPTAHLQWPSAVLLGRLFSSMRDSQEVEEEVNVVPTRAS